MSAIDIIKSVLMLLAGLGTFLIGLDIMGKNLEGFAGDKLRNLFSKISDKKILGIATGCVTTIMAQSSSATTVMVVGFVNTGMMTLVQATTIIMGANIGTTLTAYLIALQNLPISAFFCSMACVGAFMQMSKKTNLKNIGAILAGVGMLFVGLSVMSSSMSGVTNIENENGEKVIAVLLKSISGSTVWSKMLLILIGAVITAIIQSSAATTSILIGLCSAGTMELEPAIMVTLGMNIGTCISAVLASIGQSANGKRASVIHLLFNIIGTIIFSIILFAAGNYIIPFLENLKIGSDFATSISLKIAIFHTIFNVTTTILMYPFINGLTKLATLIVPDKKSDKDNDEFANKFTYINDLILKTPSIAMEMLRKEITKMAQDAKTNLQLSEEMLQNKDLSKIEEFEKREKHINFINKNLSKFLVKVSNLDITYENELEIAAYYHNISDIERIGDYAENIVEYTQDLVKAGVDFTDDCKKELQEMIDAVNGELSLTINAFENKTLKDYYEIDAAEDLTDTYYNVLSRNHIVRLNQGICNAEAASVFISLIGNLERVGDHVMNLCNSMKTYVKVPEKEQNLGTN